MPLSLASAGAADVDAEAEPDAAAGDEDEEEEEEAGGGGAGSELGDTAAEGPPPGCCRSNEVVERLRAVVVGWRHETLPSVRASVRMLRIDIAALLLENLLIWRSKKDDPRDHDHFYFLLMRRKDEKEGKSES